MRCAKARGRRPGCDQGRSDRCEPAGATGQVIDIRGPAEFGAGIKEIRDQLASIAQTLGMKAAQ